MSSNARDDPAAGEGTAAAPAVSEDHPADPPAVVPVVGRRSDRHAKRREKQGALAFLRELPVLLLVAFVLALLIKTFLVQAFYIPSASMEPTLQIGDRVLVNKVVYHLHDPRRGDVIVFSDPHPVTVEHRNPASAFFHWLTEGLGVQSSAQKDF